MMAVIELHLDLDQIDALIRHGRIVAVGEVEGDEAVINLTVG